MKDLKEKLDRHSKWLNNENGGERLNLSCAFLRGANLSYADLSCANLEGANLTGANLEGANLRDANLTGANLRDAFLRDANLSCANLSGANLSGADLRDANLRGADFRGADLRSADLRSANLSGANLRDANLTGANLPIECYTVDRIGGSNRRTTWDVTNDIVWCGCFRGTMAEFEQRIEKMKTGKHLLQYLAAVRYLKELKAISEGEE